MDQQAPVNPWKTQDSPWRWELHLLLLSAMIVFVLTVVIGIVNGQQVVKLSQRVILTHVHAGTLGWITLSVFAIALYLFGEDTTIPAKSMYLRVLSIVAAVTLPIYVLAFLSGNLIARAVFGIPTLLVFLGFFGWIIARSGKLRLGIPHLAILAVQAVSLERTNTALLPAAAFAVHPAILVTGYLILIGMALSEQSLIPRTDKLPLAGLIQITLIFLAGITLIIALLFNLPPLFGLNLLFNLTAIIIYMIRLAPRLIHLNWLGQNSTRFFAISVLFILFETGLGTYLDVGAIINLYPNGNFPGNLLVALDHSVFVGVMTNALFGLIREATARGRSLWPWADHVLFWGMNSGVIGFISSLILN
ncbi:MAG: hypothetical protein E6J34_05725, partial [Chloroflexi bacterium]